MLCTGPTDKYTYEPRSTILKDQLFVILKPAPQDLEAVLDGDHCV